MSRPILLCQGFQQAFIDAGSPTFSYSASLRRGLCERILRHVRRLDWQVWHCFLETDAFVDQGSDSIGAFAPLPTEPYFLQPALSAFATPGFAAKLKGVERSPLILMSCAGLGPIAATFLDALARRIDVYIIGDAVADVGSASLDEKERLAGICAIARAYDRCLAAVDLLAEPTQVSQPWARIRAA